MPKLELLKMRLFRKCKLKVLEQTEHGSSSTMVPSDPEIVCYKLNYGKYVLIKHTDSANPYWHPADCERRDGDRVIREANLWVAQLAPDYIGLGAFDSREELIEFLKKHFYAELLELVEHDKVIAGLKQADAAECAETIGELMVENPTMAFTEIVAAIS